MKRIILISMVAIFLLSCNKNDPTTQGKFGTVSYASKNAVSILGKSKAEAEKRILKAGFRTVNNPNWEDMDFSQAPKRTAIDPKKQSSYEDDDELYGDENATFYVYNITEEMEDMNDEEVVNAIIDSKKSAIIFQTAYINGILANINGLMFIGAEVDYVNALYLDCSRNLYSNLTKLGTWNGAITDTEDDGDEKVEYTSYQKFYSALAPLNAVFAEETGACALDLKGNGFGYHITWDKPNERVARFQINNEGYKTAIATASFSITYTSAGM